MINRVVKRTIQKSKPIVARTFSKLNNGQTPFYEANGHDRVMTTPTWPAPYYQRRWRSYPTRDNEKDDLSGLLQPLDDMTAFFAKQKLKETVSGKANVTHIENNIPLDSFVMRQEDTGRLAQAYVGDLVEFVDVANRENVRILNKSNLL